MLRVDILTLFPHMPESVLKSSMLKRAQEKKILQVAVHDIRQMATDKHRTCDDRPFGGGAGMVLSPEPIDKLAQKLFKSNKKKSFRFIYPSPQGKLFTQEMARQLSQYKHLAFLCGHYEGVDQRVLDRWVTDEVSIGDYVLTGGELPTLVMLDAIVRFVPGVLGNEESHDFESHKDGLLEYPQYTRPAEFKKMKVPDILLTGNHKAIAKWRLEQAIKRTQSQRPDLYDRYKASEKR